MGNDERIAERSTGAPTWSAGEHLVWHQELICPGERCRGRMRRFPPGQVLADGRHEVRRCPECGASTTTPAFYLSGRVRSLPRPAPALED